MELVEYEALGNSGCRFVYEKDSGEIITRYRSSKYDNAVQKCIKNHHRSDWDNVVLD